MTGDEAVLDRTIATLADRLLARRIPAGHWEGRLASSALATATAIVALVLHARAAGQGHDPRARAGAAWLIAHQNADGGWGDTTISASNLSTTLLCRAALSVARDSTADCGPALARAGAWVRTHAGGDDPPSLRRALLARYGRDRTFSAPILSMLALTGELGPSPGAWRLVPQLPFELAACPHQWFRWLRLPVVSYALPALVAIGQVRHQHRPSRMPALAWTRTRLRGRTLRVARGMQPDSGGYLEAVPLTAFVVMSLIAAGQETCAIVADGVRFLRASVRDDGSWPIDTNLATWTTTLAVDALAAAGRLSDLDRRRVAEWLRAQQVTSQHPFTHAAPGGWAWTDLSGGVPDADDTAGALRALCTLCGTGMADGAASAGITWLLGLQNGDGGIPTFCRGWGALPFDRSAPDLTAHALEAWSAWVDAVPPALQQSIRRAARRAVGYLERQQSADGAWTPLWFGNEHAPGELNPTYGTARVVRALAGPLCANPAAASIRQRGIAWLIRAQNADGGWGGAPATPSSIEETGMALDALSSAAPRDGEAAAAVSRGVRWTIAATSEGRQTPASPIGLYFARLWYFEELYPLVLGLKGLAAARR